ncbi:hypothetical protein EON80_10315 [bacterium]|nr:MAG: hypothetical protein EON80_10315 [bacterium]
MQSDTLTAPTSLNRYAVLTATLILMATSIWLGSNLGSAVQFPALMRSEAPSPRVLVLVWGGTVVAACLTLTVFFALADSSLYNRFSTRKINVLIGLAILASGSSAYAMTRTNAWKKAAVYDCIMRADSITT